MFKNKKFKFFYVRYFENVYIGWAQKYTGSNFSPMPLPILVDEFPSGIEITEIDDPSPEEEEAWRKAQVELARKNEKLENEEEEMDEEEFDEDDSNDENVTETENDD